MEAKQKLFDSFQPKAILQATTTEARAAMPSTMQLDGMVPIYGFPFRVGRESRVLKVDDKIYRVERPKQGDAKPTNDLYLLDISELLHISREHFQIEKTAQGYVLSDRGSKCGLTVGGKRVGSGAGVLQVALQDGDVIAIGTQQTKYIYTFIAS